MAKVRHYTIEVKDVDTKKTVLLAAADWDDHEHRGVLDLCRHQHPAPGDRPAHHDRAHHDRATHDRADDHGRTYHDHPGHHDQHRAPHHRADDDRYRADHHDRAGGPLTVGQPPAVSAAMVGPLLPDGGLR